MTKTGDRVGAVLSAKNGVVKFFGYGIYVGDFIPPPNAIGMGPIFHDGGIQNPRLDLASGKSVYGCECWWGSEEAVKKRFEGYIFEEVDIDEIRRGDTGDRNNS